jgi:hypothetical protein
VPLSRVPGKTINETGFENPKYGKLGEWWELFGNFIWGSVSFLKEDPDWVITFRGEGYHLGVRSFDETSGGNPLEFIGLHRVGGDPSYMVYPF